MPAAPRNETSRQTSLRLEGERALIIERTFRATPAVVFEAFTKAELVKQWWAPASRGELIECTADVRVGGGYRYVLRPHGRKPMAFYSEYREVVPGSRLVYTQVFEPMAAVGAVVVTVTFEARGDLTLLTSREVYPSAQAREATVSGGMESGMRESLEQLDALVSK